MTAAVPDMTHPTDQTLAAFADGTLSAEERQEVIEHLADCAECLDVIVMTTEIKAAEDLTALEIRPELTPSRSDTPAMTDDAPAPIALESRRVARSRSAMKVWLPLAAAAAIAVVVAMPQTRERLGFGPMRAVERVVAEAPERPSEARVSLDLPYKQPKPRMRSGNAENENTPVAFQIEAEAMEARQRAEQNPTVANRHAAGVLLMFDRKYDEAVEQLERAVATAESPSAALFNDLSAAYFGRSGFEKALENADRAWKLDPTPAAAWNRAIALDFLQRHGDATAAWKKYLEIDPQSPWAEEARQRLADIQDLP